MPAAARYARRLGPEPRVPLAGVVIDTRSGAVDAFGPPYRMSASTVTFRDLVAIVRAVSRLVTPEELVRRLWPELDAEEACSRLRLIAETARS